MAPTTNSVSARSIAAAASSADASSSSMGGAAAAAASAACLAFLPSLMTMGYLLASCASTVSISSFSMSSARSRSDSLGCSCAGRPWGSRSRVSGRGRPRCSAFDFLRSSACRRSSCCCSLRFFTSSASSSCTGSSTSMKSAGSSGATTWYSFSGAGSDPRLCRKSSRMALSRAASARLPAPPIPMLGVARLSLTSFRPS
mmetsp:Transcript_14020/g.37871  ORF Transcript_14020/g.37871 Transcript_14020/m.37871 type:complete len:200 (+) Transcript_14020:695-1294(+)